MTINARSRMFGQLRSFVEVELCGMLRWDDVKALEPEPLPLSKTGRRNPEGKYKEIAAIQFGDYVLTLCSPNADPPLGWIECVTEDHQTCEGPLDSVIWKNIGKFIRDRGIRTVQNGSRGSTAELSGEWGSPN